MVLIKASWRVWGHRRNGMAGIKNVLKGSHDYTLYKKRKSLVNRPQNMYNKKQNQRLAFDGGSYMKYDTQQCRLTYKEELAPGVFDFRLQNQAFAASAQPGQFAHLLVPGKPLRRPISICDVDQKADTLRLVFEVRGEGTQILAQYQVGDCLDVLAPLGRGFTIGDTSRRALFVGGGIGVPPLLYAAKQFGVNATVIIGFRSRDAVILKKDFEQAGCRVILHTDDGSAGRGGFVTESCREELENCEQVFACGPAPMLKAVAGQAQERCVPCQVSLEERMGCGVGACLVCACKIRKADGSEGYLHVCKDGPVFDAKEVVW